MGRLLLLLSLNTMVGGWLLIMGVTPYMKKHVPHSQSSVGFGLEKQQLNEISDEITDRTFFSINWPGAAT